MIEAYLRHNLAHIYTEWRQRAGPALPDFKEFWAAGELTLPGRQLPAGLLEAFRWTIFGTTRRHGGGGASAAGAVVVFGSRRPPSGRTRLFELRHARGARVRAGPSIRVRRAAHSFGHPSVTTRCHSG